MLSSPLVFKIISLSSFDEMGNDDVPAHHYAQALNLVNDYILIASLNNNTDNYSTQTNNGDNNNNETKDFDKITFMNAALLEKLECGIISSDFSGSYNTEIYEDNKLYCKIFLSQSNKSISTYLFFYI